MTVPRVAIETETRERGIGEVLGACHAPNFVEQLEQFLAH